jgi:sugar-specific transcriptional regulator TrmB
MIVQGEFLKRLRSAFGLNIYEVKIWTALLSKGIATAGELSDISDVPRSRSYDVLESLEKRGFVVMKLGKPIKYIAVEPEEVIKRVKKSVIDKADNQVKSIENIGTTNVFKELNILYKNGINHVDPANISGAIKGRSNVYNHIETMIKNAQTSVVIATSSQGLIRKTENLKYLFKKLNEKGVKIRIAAPINEMNKKFVKELDKIAEVKNLKEIDARFVLVDGKELLFMISNDESVHESYDIGIWVKTPFFANALHNLFNKSWPSLKKA